MYAILLAAFNGALGFFARSIIAKFFTFFALFYVCTEFIALLAPRLPDGTALSGAFGTIPPAVWYFLDLAHLDIGLPSIISAYVLRFMIRRLPVVG